MYPRGLQNTGNTCFLNSTVQALASVPAFHEWCANLLNAYGATNDSSSFTNLSGSSEQGSDDCDLPGRFADLAKLLALVRALCWTESEPSVALIPSLPLDALPPHVADYQNEQHDAHELLVGLLQAVQENLGVEPLHVAVDACRGVESVRQAFGACAGAIYVPSPRTWARVRAVSRSGLVMAGGPSRTPARARHARQPLLATIDLKAYKGVDNPFSIMVARRKVCLACLSRARAGASTGDAPGGVPTQEQRTEGADPPWTIDTETVLTVPMRTTLLAALREYCKDEPIHGYSCGSVGCDGRVMGGQDRDPPIAIAQTRILRAPGVLALHVQRLGPMGVVRGTISFDQTLDFTVQQGTQSVRLGQYELHSVVSHMAFDAQGGSGHYTAYRRRPVPVASAFTATPACWSRVNDRRTENVSWEIVRKDPYAYLLLYSKVPDSSLGREQEGRVVAALKSETAPGGQWLCQLCEGGRSSSPIAPDAPHWYAHVLQSRATDLQAAAMQSSDSEKQVQVCWLPPPGADTS